MDTLKAERCIILQGEWFEVYKKLRQVNDSYKHKCKELIDNIYESPEFDNCTKIEERILLDIHAFSGKILTTCSTLERLESDYEKYNLCRNCLPRNIFSRRRLVKL